MTDDIDTELLISLVEARPVLWDKSLELYKDRNGTRNAWEEVCIELKADFNDLQNKDKNEFGKEVMKRWTNIRDAFAKFSKKEKTKSGAGASKHKKYVYSDQLQFLKKLYITRDVEDNFEKDDGEINNTEVEEELYHKEYSTRATRVKKANQDLGSSSKKRHKADELEQMMLKALQSDIPNRHLSFFNGVIPALEKFNEDEVLRFQMGVLHLIQNINDEKRRGSQLFNYPQPPLHSSQPTTSTHPNFYIVPQKIHQPPQQASYQYYQNLDQSTASTSCAPIPHPIDSPSPAPSTSSSYNSIDFSALSPI